MTWVRPVGVCSCCFGAGCRIQGVTAGELCCRTLRTGGFAGSEDGSRVIVGKILLVWWGFQEGWWDGAFAGLESGSRVRDAAGGTGGQSWGELCCSSVLSPPSVNANLATVTF